MTTVTATSVRLTGPGTALPVCLVFLLLLTVLALATVSTATLESAMAANTQHMVDAFYMAENAIERSFEAFIEDPGLLRDNVPYVIRRTGVAGRGAYEATTQFAEYGTQCTASNNELMTRLYFDVTARAFAARNAVAHHTQGFFICRRGIAPVSSIRSRSDRACSPANCPGLPAENIPIRTFWTDHGD